MFNGKELDEETGLYYYGARYYNPRISQWLSVDPIALYDPINEVEHYLDGQHNGGYFNPRNTSVYGYCYENPIKWEDPNGKQVVAVHGTWSDQFTWKDQKGINSVASKIFGNKKDDYTFWWSGGNYASMRLQGAKKLINHIREARKNIDPSEPITLVGHSHGGNVSIEAINMMVEMEEFKDVNINLISINTPVRSDHQLSEEAKERVDHINVYDYKDPVQANGGNSLIILPERRTAKKGAGEYGSAGRIFEGAENISVDNPQGLLRDFHNSHNRTSDWSNKIKSTNEK